MPIVFSDARVDHNDETWARNLVKAYADLFELCSARKLIHSQWKCDWPTRNQIVENYLVHSRTCAELMKVDLVIDVVGGGERVVYKQAEDGTIVRYSRRPNRSGRREDIPILNAAWQQAIRESISRVQVPSVGDVPLEPCVAFPCSPHTRTSPGDREEGDFPFSAVTGYSTTIRRYKFTELKAEHDAGAHDSHGHDISHLIISPLTNHVLVTCQTEDGEFRAILRIRILPAESSAGHSHSLWTPAHAQPADDCREYRDGEGASFPVKRMNPLPADVSQLRTGMLGHFMPNYSLGHRAQRIYGQSSALGGVGASSASSAAF